MPRTCDLRELPAPHGLYASFSVRASSDHVAPDSRAFLVKADGSDSCIQATSALTGASAPVR